MKQLESSLRQNVIVGSQVDFESTEPDLPKILHWFEWGKKKLNIYDIFENTTSQIDLDIQFKIPSFSRSILIPDSSIFLIGGEEPEYFSRKEIYAYYHTKKDNKLYPKAQMPYKKFDFTLCYLNGFIYVICGKNSSSDVIDTCDR